MTMPRLKFSIYLSDSELHSQLKVYAASVDRTMSEICESLIAQFLAGSTDFDPLRESSENQEGPSLNRRTKTALALMSAGYSAEEAAKKLATLGIKVSAGYLAQLARRRHGRAYIESVERPMRARILTQLTSDTRQ